jgi:hypothetical protein
MDGLLRALLATASILFLLTGTAGQPAAAQAPGTAADSLLTEQDLFYLHRSGTSDGGTMDREPDNGELTGGGGVFDGPPCAPPVAGVPYPCFGITLTAVEPLASDHAAGDQAHVVFWLASNLGPLQRLRAEAFLFAEDGTQVASGTSDFQRPPPSVPFHSIVPVTQACGEWTVDMDLAEGLAAGEYPTLQVRFEGAVAAACHGGGADGSRLDLTPAA